MPSSFIRGPQGSGPCRWLPGQAAGTAPRESGDIDEWATLRPFRDGDSPRQVAWKAYARGAPLLVKEYTASGSIERLFDFATLTGLDTEQRLSQLARWIVNCAADGERFGLRLPQQLIELDQGHGTSPALPARTGPVWQRVFRPMSDQPASSHRATHWMVGAYVIGALLHLGQVPLWVIVLACSGAAWALAAAHGRARLPGRVFKVSLTVALTGTVLAMFHTLNGLNAGSALLVLMGAIKLLEATTRRDRLIVVGVAFYLLLAACLASQELLRAPLYLLQAWVCCTALLYAAHPDAPLPSRAAMRISARSLAFALPLALLLFALFPRLSGSFWSLGGSGQAQTGLSDTMSPGSISELGNSARSGIPGLVCRTHCRRHSSATGAGRCCMTSMATPGRACTATLYRRETLQYRGTAYQYQIRLEPDSTPWWPALDTVQSATAPGTTDHARTGSWSPPVRCTMRSPTLRSPTPQPSRATRSRASRGSSIRMS